MQYSLATCLILALGAVAVPLEGRDTVVAATQAVAGPGQSVTAIDIEGGPTPIRFNNIASQPKATSLPKDIADKIPDASSIASAGAAAAVNAMTANFLKDFDLKNSKTCYGSIDSDGHETVEYSFNKVSSKGYKSFCSDWDKAIKSSKYKKHCPKEMYGYKGWISSEFKAVSESEASGFVTVKVPKGVELKTVQNCLGETYKGLKEPYGKIGSCGFKITKTSTTKFY